MIYWGYGKGKSTAAIGLALRALGQGQRVLFIQFIKGEWHTGEMTMFEKITEWQERGELPKGAYFEFYSMGRGFVRIMGDKKPIEEHKEAAREGLAYARTKLSFVQSEQCLAFDVVILDEILSAVDSMLLTADDIKELIRVKSPQVHLLLTGHKEYPELAELADLVTRMEKVKHPYDQGLLAQRGVDF